MTEQQPQRDRVHFKIDTTAKGEAQPSVSIERFALAESLTSREVDFARTEAFEQYAALRREIEAAQMRQWLPLPEVAE